MENPNSQPNDHHEGKTDSEWQSPNSGNEVREAGEGSVSSYPYSSSESQLLDTGPSFGQPVELKTGSSVPHENVSVLTPGQRIEISDQFWELDPRNVIVSQLSGYIFSAFLTLGALVGLVFLWFTVESAWVFYSLLGAGATLCLGSWVMSLVWPGIDHRHASWRLDAEGLEIRQGVFWKHRVTVPLGRVQHSDVSQGPLQRMYDLGTLKVHTAGTTNASVGLEGLEHRVALELRDLIVAQRKDQRVV